MKPKFILPFVFLFLYTDVLSQIKYIDKTEYGIQLNGFYQTSEKNFLAIHLQNKTYLNNTIEKTYFNDVNFGISNNFLISNRIPFEGVISYSEANKFKTLHAKFLISHLGNITERIYFTKSIFYQYNKPEKSKFEYIVNFPYFNYGISTGLMLNFSLKDSLMFSPFYKIALIRTRDLPVSGTQPIEIEHRFIDQLQQNFGVSFRSKSKTSLNIYISRKTFFYPSANENCEKYQCKINIVEKYLMLDLQIFINNRDKSATNIFRNSYTIK